MAEIQKKAKRTVDTWKKKKWYIIEADPLFNNKEIGKTIAADNKNLIDKKITKSLEEITNNIKDSAYQITFKINKVTAGKAETIIDNYNIKDSYLRRFVKREKSKIEDILYLETKDEQKLKLKIIFISGAKYSTSLRAKARNIMKEYFKNEIKEKTLQEAWNDIIFQKLSDKCKQKLIKLGYVNKIIIAKAKRM